MTIRKPFGKRLPWRHLRHVYFNLATRKTTPYNTRMTHIEDIRNFLNAATVRLRELEEVLEQRSTSVHGWDANAIATACAEQWDLRQGTLHSPSQERPVAHARQAAMYLMAKHTSKSRKDIAKFLRPDMDVSTVNYAVRNVPMLMQADTNFAGKVVRAETTYLIAKQNRK